MAEVAQALTSEQSKDVNAECKALEDNGLLIKQWDLNFLKADMAWCGRDGSPTKVHRIQSVVLAAGESVQIEPTKAGIEAMVHEFIEEHTIG